MDSHNRNKKEAPSELHLQEISLSETYRILEGFDNPSIIAQSKNFSQKDFDRLKTIALKNETKTVATSFCSIFCTLLVSSVVLGWTIDQLSISFQQLTKKLSSQPIDFVWSSGNPKF